MFFSGGSCRSLFAWPCTIPVGTLDLRLPCIRLKAEYGPGPLAEDFPQLRNTLMTGELPWKRGMESYTHTNNDVVRRNDQQSTEIKELYGHIIVGVPITEQTRNFKREVATQTVGQSLGLAG